MTKSKRKNAFTLIELLTTISIMALLLIVSIPAFGKLKAQEELDNAAEDVRQMILEAQNLAMAPNEEMRAKGIDYISIQKQADNNQKIFLYFVAAKNSKISLVKEYNLPAGLTIKDSGIAALLYFSVPDAKIPDKVNYGGADSFIMSSLTNGNLFNGSPFLAIESPKVAAPDNIRYIKVDVKTGKITVSKTK